jgi:hypothetical protein
MVTSVAGQSRWLWRRRQNRLLVVADDTIDVDIGRRVDVIGGLFYSLIIPMKRYLKTRTSLA